MSKTIRWDVYCGPPVDAGTLPPSVTVVGYPPHPSEGSRDYMRRVQIEVMAATFAPKPSLLSRIGKWLFGDEQ